MSLIKYIIRRLIIMIPILFGVLLITFVLTHMMPGNPYLTFVTHGADSEIYAYEQQVERLGLNKPIWEQFLIYLGTLFSGDWGNSISLARDKPVWEMIAPRFGRTLEITIISVFLSSIIGLRVGVISSTHRNKTSDTVIRFIALIGVAVPIFWLGMLLQYFFGYQLDLILGEDFIPVFGYKAPGAQNPIVFTSLRTVDCIISMIVDPVNLTVYSDLFWDTILHLILPVFCLTFVTVAGITRQTRSSMLETLELDYIRTARAKGCQEKTVINSHALRNALIPTVTIIGMNFGYLLSGAVLTETTFNLKGMGNLTMQAIAAIDYNVITASVFLTTFLFIVVNLITDIIYGIIDPRIRF